MRCTLINNFSINKNFTSYDFEKKKTDVDGYTYKDEVVFDYSLVEHTCNNVSFM